MKECVSNHTISEVEGRLKVENDVEDVEVGACVQT
jgi:hypothetical protein